MSDFIQKIEDWAGEKIVSKNSVGGGCIANAQRVKTRSGREFFLKSGFNNQMFINEANGLKELRKPNAVRAPDVYLFDASFILMEFIPSGGKKSGFMEEFGASFARMHKFTGESYGFFEDNFIGATEQLNIAKGDESTDWPTFYWNKRIKFQYGLAVKNSHGNDKLKKGIAGLENIWPEIFKGSEEKPTLLHGDLWGGNYMSDQNGEPVLIDPAVYYGHREADLAMTKLFGGFSRDFYKAYNREYPLKPGYEYRENIYLLYHVLNHLNLFGSSYYGQAINLIYSYL